MHKLLATMFIRFLYRKVHFSVVICHMAHPENFSQNISIISQKRQGLTQQIVLASYPSGFIHEVW